VRKKSVRGKRGEEGEKKRAFIISPVIGNVHVKGREVRAD
jgi:hypothetical protein